MFLYALSDTLIMPCSFLHTSMCTRVFWESAQTENGGQLMWSLATNYRPGVNKESKARQVGLYPWLYQPTAAAEHFQDIYWYKITLGVKPFNPIGVLTQATNNHPGSNLYRVTSNKLPWRWVSHRIPNPRTLSPNDHHCQHARPNFCSKLTPSCFFLLINRPWADYWVGRFSVISGMLLLCHKSSLIAAVSVNLEKPQQAGVLKNT